MDAKKILIVDDSRFTIELIKSIVEPEHINVISANEGKEGIKKAKEEHPDLVILDVLLPELDGYKVCEVLKSDEKTKNIPVLMLTVKDTISDVQKGFSSKADYYMTKPFENETLLSNIKQIFSDTDSARNSSQK